MNPRLIIIEDEEPIRELYKRQLTLAGMQTDGFANGKEGLEAISKTQYNLLLLDIMLPDMNGLEILKQIKANPQTKDLPVLLLTNLGQDAVIKEGFQLGAEGYMIKAAYTPDQIVQEVKNILQRTQQTPATPPQQPQ
ncbi:MAG: hypothetical protein ACD_30C00018G0008 [uncultured bacterium]|uniref:Response regulator n=4 Tax=Candidatus Daviesiibacteriota TaxID=1752718 RepID=A0A0G0F4F7_9BACT|nr:MAG: hypothetical protein ACD_30C00018G0008 [uncultured bacterium]KKQ08390.1 MAG: Response regulator [Candidatus Daviesbacteria bacterium GW2011_GWB1_36_5]KKQ15569.1 MAG: Response regulator [Candidatus Daviesbacteria bacterium GW2011_GWA1_36_8]OGE17539.1 MAG: hypothetical protein A2858_01400 [Candidatus Daviesbacteria bacterium RIFCSPHIGHO2_01_FULL_36_37]OGE36633.1 MAG: hypothetical protein A3E66_03245 [Candidatus Daviesbacteria bacterium RIFCSPHIGHO2_12_FULL_37_16]